YRDRVDSGGQPCPRTIPEPCLRCSHAVTAPDRPEERAAREPIRLVPYNPDWPAVFEVERRRLLSLFGAEVRAIEHIGSTAISGMPAKPIVDVLAGVDS